MKDRRKELMNDALYQFRENDGRLSGALKPLIDAIVTLEEKVDAIVESIGNVSHE